MPVENTKEITKTVSEELLSENAINVYETILTEAFWENFLLIVFGGFLGGCTSLLVWVSTRIVKSKEAYFDSKTLYASLLLSNGISGIAGGLAVNGFLLLFVDSYSNKPLVVVGISVIAGFAAKAMLPKIAKTLEDKILDKVKKNEKSLKKLKKFTHNQKLDIEKMQNEFKTKLKFERNIDVAFEVLSERKIVETDKELALNGLRWNKKIDPKDRRTIILLPRMYVEKYNNILEGIKLSQEYIDNYKDDSSIDKKTLGAVYYNLACYQSFYIQENQRYIDLGDEKIEELSQDTKDSYFEKSLNNLKIAVKLDSRNIKDITDDTEDGDLVLMFSLGWLDEFKNEIEKIKQDRDKKIYTQYIK